MLNFHTNLLQTHKNMEPLTYKEIYVRGATLATWHTFLCENC